MRRVDTLLPIRAIEARYTAVQMFATKTTA